MAVTPVRIPRLNANDDVVKLVRIAVAPGQKIGAEELLAEVETAKIVVEVTAPDSGYVLRIEAAVEDMISVGDVLLWLGQSLDEFVPEVPAATAGPDKATRVEVTAKARKLLALHGLEVAQVPSSGDRVTAEDVEHYIGAPRSTPAEKIMPPSPSAATQLALTRAEPLTSAERAMIRTVQWHAASAAPAYLEVSFNHGAWRKYSTEFAAAHRLLIDPLLGLLARRVVAITREVPALNSAIDSDYRLIYDTVNLGFTVRTKTSLVVVVVREATAMEELEFVKALSKLQRDAFRNRLTLERTTGATIGFTSLANARVVRHIPILLPHTSLMIAHSGGTERGTIGVTYDHRALDGELVANALARLCDP